MLNDRKKLMPCGMWPEHSFIRVKGKCINSICTFCNHKKHFCLPEIYLRLGSNADSTKRIFVGFLEIEICLGKLKFNERKNLKKYLQGILICSARHARGTSS